MSRKILVGPILGVEGESTYSVCFLTSDSCNSATLTLDGNTVTAQPYGELPGHRFWRASAEVTVPDGNSGRQVAYEIELDGEAGRDRADNERWQFYLPGRTEAPRIAYASCNGASKSGQLGPLEAAYDLWNRMVVKHDEAPYALLLMGGDQVYCDSIWQDVKALADWPELSWDEKLRKRATNTLKRQLDSFYLNTIYKTRWGDRRMMHMMASVPSVMMWDDHDIFDGWGSFPSALQNCDVYQAIFAAAQKYFALFQARTTDNAALIGDGSAHFSQCVSFRGTTIVAMDNRSERTIDRIMGSDHWRELKAAISAAPADNDLYLMSAVPVVYRDFSAVEAAMSATPWQESLEDDVLDHWRARRHEGERRKLIGNLLRDARRRSDRRTLILSGDVHVGCMGIITDRSEGEAVKIHQIISSGIVHPAPSWLEWHGIRLATNDDPEPLNEDGSICAQMVKTVGGEEYIRNQNFASIEPGNDGQLWVVWECKNGERPLYPIR